MSIPASFSFNLVLVLGAYFPAFNSQPDDHDLIEVENLGGNKSLRKQEDFCEV